MLAALCPLALIISFVQFLADRMDARAGTFEILGDEARHIVRVLRKRKGDVLRLFDGKGTILWGCIEEAGPQRVRGKLVERPASAVGGGPQIHLYQALPKGEKWEWVLQKGAEVGISSFIPLISERTIVRLSKDDIVKKMARWKKILQAACKQCGLAEIPALYEPVAFNDVFRLPSSSLSRSFVLFCWESELAGPLPSVLMAQLKSQSAVSISLFIGPEGGWSIREVETAKNYGALMAGLGPRVLRTETAPIVAAAMIEAVWMLRQSDKTISS